MVFIRQGKENDDITFYGELYLSDKSQLKSTTVYNFLGRRFEAKHLAGNWYWVECYEDVTPGP